MVNRRQYKQFLQDVEEGQKVDPKAKKTSKKSTKKSSK